MDDTRNKKITTLWLYGPGKKLVFEYISSCDEENLDLMEDNLFSNPNIDQFQKYRHQ